MSAKAPVKLYVTNHCGFCKAAERLLDSMSVPYETENLSAHPDRRIELVQQTGWRTVPVIFIGDELVGGFTELQSLKDSGQLDDRLAKAGYQRQ